MYELQWSVILTFGFVILCCSSRSTGPHASLYMCTWDSPTSLWSWWKRQIHVYKLINLHVYPIMYTFLFAVRNHMRNIVCSNFFFSIAFFSYKYNILVRNKILVIKYYTSKPFELHVHHVYHTLWKVRQVGIEKYKYYTYTSWAKVKKKCWTCLINFTYQLSNEGN